ncbi:hypothetical protein AQUCO_08000006v1 [Aquilegia coerulea]|uniref:Uncharacterized protein n=1 Tax=Aquilegia coerulea TaxID=218851 RepID=A0A2G5C7R6_AQUCA|nr:hypothetical protein AQUCO_08000006v1 [Aquilegia coerulea]
MSLFLVFSIPSPGKSTQMSSEVGRLYRLGSVPGINANLTALYDLIFCLKDLDNGPKPSYKDCIVLGNGPSSGSVILPCRQHIPNKGLSFLDADNCSSNQ